MIHYVDFIKAWVLAHVSVKSERGATMVEYGLMVALIAIVVAVAAKALGGSVSDLFNHASASASA